MKPTFRKTTSINNIIINNFVFDVKYFGNMLVSQYIKIRRCTIPVSTGFTWLMFFSFLIKGFAERRVRNKGNDSLGSGK